jgi:hypothetical protein
LHLIEPKTKKLMMLAPVAANIAGDTIDVRAASQSIKVNQT